MYDFIILNTYATDYARTFVNLQFKRIVRPAGAHQLASWLSSQGLKVKVIDFASYINVENLELILRKFIGKNTKAIGVSTTFIGKPSENFLEPPWLLSLRKNLSDIDVEWILGGSRNNTFLPTRYKWKFVEGYAEDIMLDYLRPGLVDTNSKFNITTFDKFYLPNLHLDPNEFVSIELSRGCQYKCKFCNFSMIGKTKNSYIRNLKYFKDELIRLYETYGTTNYYIVDDTVNESYEKICMLAEIASSLPFKLNWVGYLRLDLIGSNIKTINILRDSGLISAYFGIESFNYEAAKTIGKGYNGVHGKEFLLELKKHWKDDITFHCSLIVGLPGEDMDSINKTQQWFIESNMHSWDWKSLFLDKENKFTLAKSEFDKNYENYGYFFPNQDQTDWHNNLWTKKIADEKAYLMNRDIFKLIKVGPWILGELASTGAMTVNNLKNMKYTDLQIENFNIASEKVLEKYISNLLNE